jgi:hypothetical protein
MTDPESRFTYTPNGLFLATEATEITEIDVTQALCELCGLCGRNVQLSAV